MCVISSQPCMSSEVLLQSKAWDAGSAGGAFLEGLSVLVQVPLAADKDL